MEVHGFCDERFARVRDIFERNFEEHGEVGATFAATIEGEFVVDLWPGHADAARTRPWDRDTIVNVYSTTKTMSFLCGLLLADRGKLDFHAKVTDYWPEYGQNGKEQTEVRHFFSHSAGLPGFDPYLTSAEPLYDWQGCIDNLVAQAPWWEPGSQSGYHAITQGYLIGELVRRIDGRTLGRYFREEIAEPLDADFHIGMPASEFPRVAEMIPDTSPVDPAFGEPDPDSITGRVFASAAADTDAVNTPGWRQAELPAAGGHGNARAVVRAQTPVANGGGGLRRGPPLPGGLPRHPGGADERGGRRDPPAGTVRHGLRVPQRDDAHVAQRTGHVLGRRRGFDHRGGPGRPCLPVLRDEPDEERAPRRPARRQRWVGLSTRRCEERKRNEDMSDQRLAGKVAWVTGSSRGIGRVVADHLGSLGARVVVHGHHPHLHAATGRGGFPRRRRRRDRRGPWRRGARRAWRSDVRGGRGRISTPSIRRALRPRRHPHQQRRAVTSAYAA